MEIPVTEDFLTEREARVRMVSESAAGVLKGDRGRARGQRFRMQNVDAKKWSEMAGMGWLILRLPAERGGLGMGLSELCAIARAMGAELSPEPLPMAALVAAALPEAALVGLLACAEILLPAFAPYGGAAPSLQGGQLTGLVEPVPMAGAAAGFLVQTDNGAALVRSDAKGVTLDVQQTHDGEHLGRLRFDHAAAHPVAADMLRIRDEAALVLSAQLLGLAETAFDMTIAYLKERRQFGVPIGSFQVLQHRAVDLFLELSLARAIIEAASERLDDGASDAEAALQASFAKARATRAASAVTQAAIQMHGGIGYTDEADIGLYLRKVMSLSGLLGTERFHRDRALAMTEIAE